MIIAVDFDGTCVEHAYPKVGKDIGAVPVLRALVENGHKLILWTMRDSKPHPTTGDGTMTPTNVDCLTEAVHWFADNNIPLWGINENPTQNWSESNKQYAQLYIDDAALGCPMINGHVNWVEISKYLVNHLLITPEQFRDYATPDWLYICQQ